MKRNLSPLKVSIGGIMLQVRKPCKCRQNRVQVIVAEILSGRRIVSVEAGMLDRLEKFKELSQSAVELLVFGHYQYLVTARRQAGNNPI